MPTAPGPAAIPPTMTLDRDQIDHALKHLRKMLRHGNDLRAPEVIHALRAALRHAEATLYTLGFDKRRIGSHLLKDIKTLGRHAGQVRDMDVMTEALIALPVDGQLISLLELAGAQRLEETHSLARALKNLRFDIRRRLKRCRKLAEKIEQSDRAASLHAELAAWPHLTPANLHEFRVKVKALLDTARLSTTPGPALPPSLEEVKDAIGIWHDWHELAETATARFKDNPRSKLVRRIRTQSDKLKVAALSQATTVQKRLAAGRKKARKSSRAK